MLRCANCNHANPPGSVFCSECGAQLFAADMTTQNIRTDKMADPLGGAAARVEPPASYISTDAWGSIHLMESGQILPLTTRSDYTLGRISEGQPVMPDIDLSPYNAYANGVSRIHATIRRDGKRIIVMDLGSANGSYVNGKRIAPNTERLVNHGDVIALGKLKFQILIR